MTHSNFNGESCTTNLTGWLEYDILEWLQVELLVFLKTVYLIALCMFQSDCHCDVQSIPKADLLLYQPIDCRLNKNKGKSTLPSRPIWKWSLIKKIYSYLIESKIIYRPKFTTELRNTVRMYTLHRVHKDLIAINFSKFLVLP